MYTKYAKLQEGPVVSVGAGADVVRGGDPCGRRRAHQLIPLLAGLIKKPICVKNPCGRS